MLFPLKPLSLVGRIIDAVLASSMAKPIFDFSFIGTTVGPSVGSSTSDAVIGEFSLIDYSVGPREFSLAVEQSVIEISFVSIAILEGDLAGAVETLSVNLAILRAGGDFSFPIIVKDLG